MSNNQKQNTKVPEVTMDDALDLYLRMIYPEGLPEDIDKETLKANLMRKIAADRPQWADRDGYVSDEELQRRKSKEYNLIKARIIEDANKEEIPTDPNERYLYERDKEAKENAALKREEEKEAQKKEEIIEKAKEEKSERPTLDPQLMIQQMLAQKVKEYQRLKLDQQKLESEPTPKQEAKEKLSIQNVEPVNPPEKKTEKKEESLQHSKTEPQPNKKTEPTSLKVESDTPIKSTPKEAEKKDTLDVSPKKEKPNPRREVKPSSKKLEVDSPKSSHSKQKKESLGVDERQSKRPKKKKLSFSERRKKRKQEALQFEKEMQKKQSHLKSSEEKLREEKKELLKAFNSKVRSGMKTREDLLLPRNEFGKARKSRKEALSVNQTTPTTNRKSYLEMTTSKPEPKEETADQKRYAALDMNISSNDMDMGFSMEMEL